MVGNNPDLIIASERTITSTLIMSSLKDASSGNIVFTIQIIMVDDN